MNNDFYCMQEAFEMAELLEESVEPHKLIVSGLIKATEAVVNFVFEFDNKGELKEVYIDEV